MSEQPYPEPGAYVSSGQIYAEVVSLRIAMEGIPVRVKDLEADVTALKLAQAQSHGANQTWKSWLPMILTVISIALGALYFSAH